MEHVLGGGLGVQFNITHLVMLKRQSLALKGKAGLEMNWGMVDRRYIKP